MFSNSITQNGAIHAQPRNKIKTPQNLALNSRNVNPNRISPPTSPTADKFATLPTASYFDGRLSL
jgi:hypothetical protein